MSGFDDKPLNDWLNKKNSGHEHDFDKEAREGFEMLANEEEALLLKSIVDKKIKEQLFDDKKSRRPIYWVAAAAMLIISGLSGYFIINDTTNSNNVAIARSPEPDNQNSAFEKSFDDKSAEVAAAPTEPTPAPSRKKSAHAPAEANADQAMVSSQSEKDMAGTRDDESPVEPIAVEEAAKPLGNVSNTAKDAAEDEVQQKRNETSLSKNDFKKEKSAKAKLTEPMAVSPGFMENKAWSSNNCYYKGGNEALMKELDKKLSAKNLNRNFDALLFISANKKVTKVELSNKDQFTESEQAELLNILKSLDDFKFSISPEATVVSEFNLHYHTK